MACPSTHVLFSPPLFGIFSGLAVGQAAAQPARRSRPGMAAMERAAPLAPRTLTEPMRWPLNN
eukprot:15353708-Alexandrium_andersonii.AAC.1